MANALIKVTGIAEVQRMLREAPKELAASGFVKALSAAGNTIAAAVEAAAPFTSRWKRRLIL